MICRVLNRGGHSDVSQVARAGWPLAGEDAGTENHGGGAVSVEQEEAGKQFVQRCRGLPQPVRVREMLELKSLY